MLVDISKLDLRMLLGMGDGVRGSRVSPHQTEGNHKALSIPEARGQFFSFQFLNIGPTWAVEEVTG